MRRIILDFLIITVLVITVWYVYSKYERQVIGFFVPTSNEFININGLTLDVSIADDESERRSGLSGVKELKELEGKLFVFENEGRQGIWMKDMLIPLDILWINNELEIVHIEENISPDTYPTTFSSIEPARFVLEVNAFLVESFKIKVGDEVLIPADVLPRDIRRSIISDKELQ